jgi:mevalonate pyrophosphate decarboxylase
MPRNSLSTFVLIMIMMMCLPEEVLCYETHKSGSNIDINLQHQHNNDLFDTYYGCPTVVAKISIDESFHTFVSFSRTNPTIRNS